MSYMPPKLSEKDPIQPLAKVSSSLSSKVTNVQDCLTVLPNGPSFPL